MSLSLSVFSLYSELSLFLFPLIVFALPTETIKSPTSSSLVQKSKITAAPEHHAELMKRDGLNTCGYESGNPALPVTCASTLTCVVFKEYGLFECCSASNCNARTKCYHSTDGATCTTCSQDPGAFVCNDPAAPYCYLYSFTDVQLYDLACGPTQRAPINGVVQTIFGAANAIGTTSSPDTSSTSSTSTTTPDPPTPTPPPPCTNPNGCNANPNPSPSGLSTGSIIGIAISAVGTVLSAALTAGYKIYKHKKKTHAQQMQQGQEPAGQRFSLVPEK